MANRVTFRDAEVNRDASWALFTKIFGLGWVVQCLKTKQSANCNKTTFKIVRILVEKIPKL